MHGKYESISNDTLELLLHERENLRKELAQKEQAYRTFLEESPLLVKGKDGADVRQERLNSIQAKRSNVLLRRVEIQGQLAEFEAARKEGRSREALLAMIAEFSTKRDADDPRKDRTVSLQDQLVPLLLEEQKLLETRGDKHPEVVTVRKRIQAIRDLMTQPSGAFTEASAPATDRIEAHAQALRERLQYVVLSEELLAKLFQDEQSAAKKMASYEIQDETFRTNIMLSRQALEAITRPPSGCQSGQRRRRLRRGNHQPAG